MRTGCNTCYVDWSVNETTVDKISNNVINNFISMSIDANISKMFHIEDQQVGYNKLWSIEDRNPLL